MGRARRRPLAPSASRAAGGPPLGLFEDSVIRAVAHTVLAPGDTLVLHTDGLTESMSPEPRAVRRSAAPARRSGLTHDGDLRRHAADADWRGSTTHRAGSAAVRRPHAAAAAQDGGPRPLTASGARVPGRTPDRSCRAPAQKREIARGRPRPSTGGRARGPHPPPAPGSRPGRRAPACARTGRRGVRGVQRRTPRAASTSSPAHAASSRLNPPSLPAHTIVISRSPRTRSTTARALTNAAGTRRRRAARGEQRQRAVGRGEGECPARHALARVLERRVAEDRSPAPCARRARRRRGCPVAASRGASASAGVRVVNTSRRRSRERPW